MQVRLNGAIFAGQNVPTRLRPPSDTVDLLIEEIGYRHGLGRPDDTLLRLWQVAETANTVWRDISPGVFNCRVEIYSWRCVRFVI